MDSDGSDYIENTSINEFSDDSEDDPETKEQHMEEEVQDDASQENSTIESPAHKQQRRSKTSRTTRKGRGMNATRLFKPKEPASDTKLAGSKK